jgi:methyltransferase (TIGR00027 family)
LREGQPSGTAERVALQRAAHQLLDTPRILDDPLAIKVIRPDLREDLLAHPEHNDRSPMSRPTRALVVVRTRIAEDELASGGARQYVLLGAGLDTFAYRNPHAHVRVFEVDEPSTQRLKRERLAAAGIQPPGSVTFVTCDFSRDSLPQVLAAAGFDQTQPAVVAWLGVVMYLDRQDVFDTLRYLATLPARSAVIFDYALPPESLPWLRRIFYRKVLERLAAIGEPWKSFLEPEPLRTELLAMGFASVDDLGADDINRRYLPERRDGLQAGGIGRIAVARR